MSRTSAVRLSAACAAMITGAGLFVAPPAGASAPSGGHRPPGHSHQSSRTIALPTGLQPEGITWAGDRFYVGSLADGRVVSGSLRGGPTSVLLPGADGRQLRGLAVNERARLLWAVGNVGSAAHVWAIDLRSGRIRADVPVPGGVFLNDLIVTPGAVWVTDSRVQRLTRLSTDRAGLPTGSPRFVPLRGAWPGDLGGNAANGIRALDARHVVLDHSTAGGLWSVDLRTGATVSVPVRGRQITAGDGLERRGDTLWVVRGLSDTTVSQLRLRLGASGWSASYERTLSDRSLDVPSTATYARGALFAVNARFGATDPATTRYYVTVLPVRC